MKKVLRTLLFTFVALAMSYAAYAQEVSGVVSDEDGNLLPGVTVLNVDRGNGVVTNLDGAYTIQAVSGAMLQFSFVGMTTQTIQVGNSTTMNVTLSEDAIGLEEVVVVGYGQTKQVTITGAVSAVNSDDLLRSPTASVANALAGKVSGLSAIQNTGQPGGDVASLFIRGIATLNDATPLTIVDGVERPFSQIDPEEIESISILKDASATAVYGVRGANGVIIVTTKRGQRGETKISVSTSLALQQPTMMLDKSNSEIYALGHNERNINDGNDVEFSDEEIEIFRNGGNMLYPDMDWYDYIFRDYSPMSRSNITINGGTDRVRYFTSLGYLSQAGQINDFDSRYNENFSFNRYNFRSNLDIDVTKSTLLKVTIGGRSEIRNTPKQREEGMWKEANWAQPMAGLGIVDGNWISTSGENMGLEFKDPIASFYGKGFDNQTRNTLDFDIDLIQDLDFIVKGLKAKVKASYNTNYTHTKSRGTSPNRYEAITDPSDSTQVVLRKIQDENKLSYSESTGKGRNWYLESSLLYNRSFNDHDISGLLLFNQRVQYYPSQFSDIPNRLMGIVSRVTYNYRTKYLAEVNMGYNGSENFAEGQRFGFFPSASVGWIVSEESFMENIDFLNYLKIRGSYGIVGNDKLGSARFVYLPDSWDYNTPGYNFGYDNPTDQPGATELRIGNPFVTWETAVKRNIGFNASFFDSKLGLGFDYFHEDRSDILITRNTVPSYVAAVLPVVNMGEVENKGFEIELKWHQKVNSDFSYRINANMSYARNTRVFVDEVPPAEPYLSQTGTPVGQPFGYKVSGFFTDSINTSDTLSSVADHGGIRYPGDVMYEDLNNDGVINDLDMMAIGHSDRVPEYNFGANIFLKWKRFDLSMTVTGVKNTSRILPSYFREPFGGQNRGLFTYLYEGRWTEESAATAEFPRFSKVSGGNNYRNSDLYIVDASYIRLKNVELGYTIKSPALQKAGLRNIRAFVNGSNLLTISNFYFYDPESRPGSAGLYPMIKMYNMGIKFNF